MPTLPVEPESIESMQARWPVVMQFEYGREIILSGGIRPGEIRANVFDFPGGLRLIASVERRKDGKRILHVSASFAVDSEEYRNMEAILFKCRNKMNRTIELWAKTVTDRIAKIAGKDADGLVYAGIVMPGCIPHWSKEIEDVTADGVPTPGD